MVLEGDGIFKGGGRGQGLGMRFLKKLVGGW
jgi:hypothetical protein